MVDQRDPDDGVPEEVKSHLDQLIKWGAWILLLLVVAGLFILLWRWI